MSSFRPIDSSSNIRKSVELDCGSTQREGHKNNCVPRRFSFGQSTRRRVRERHPRGSQVPAEVGLVNKQEKISESTNPLSRIFRINVGHAKQQDIFARKKDCIVKEGSRANYKDRVLELGQREKSGREVSFCIVRGATGKTAFKTSPTCGKRASPRSEESQIHYSNKSSAGGLLVVEETSQGSENLHLSGNCIRDDGRFGQGLGGPGQRETHQWIVDGESDPLAYKPQGAFRGSSSNPADINSTAGETCSYSVRQQNSCILHTKPGRYQIYSTDRSGNENSRTGRQEQNRDLGLLHTGDLQRNGRQSFSSKAASRLASLQSRDQLIVQKVGNSSGRSFCDGFLESCPELCLSRCKGQECTFHRRFQQNVEFRASLGFPSTSSHSPGTIAFKQGQGQVCANSTEMGTSILESRFEAQSIEPSDLHSKSTTSSTGCNTEYSPPKCPKPSFGGLVDTGWSHITYSWDIDDIKLLESSWRKSSWKTYSAPWKAWVKRCNRRNLDPKKPDPADVAQYLSNLHRTKHLAPGTIKLHKSVIATLADPMRREEISSHPLVRHIIRAIENSHPAPVKKSIWDVEQLVLCMENSVINEESLFEVSRHVALILLLASGRRIYDLTLLRIDEDHLKLNEDSVIFWPAYGSKTDKSNHRQSGWQVSKGSTRNLDPLYWTKKLIGLSASRRQARNNLTCLFVSTRGAVKPASRAMIAGWVKTALIQLGIECSPGSIRSAVASSRRQNGVPLDVILSNGNWKSDKNVFKFYFKEIIRKPLMARPVSDLVHSSFKPI